MLMNELEWEVLCLYEESYQYLSFIIVLNVLLLCRFAEKSYGIRGKIILFGFLFVKKIEKTNVEIKSKTKAMKSIVNSINRL